jgi:hypothetical protein
MAGYVGHVYVWYDRNAKPPRDVQECIDSRLSWTQVRDPWAWPRTCDYYVMHSQLSAPAERAAACMNAIPVCMPGRRPSMTPQGRTAIDWLRLEIWQRAHDLGADVYIFVPNRTGEQSIFPAEAMKDGPGHRS